MALKNKPIQADALVDARVAAAIAVRLRDGQLTCAAAWDAAGHLGVQPGEVGRTADAMRVRLCACQLGFFGRALGEEPPKTAGTAMPEGLATALLGEQADRREITCARLRQEADRFGVTRPAAGRVADRLGIKVRDCDLGAF